MQVLKRRSTDDLNVDGGLPALPAVLRLDGERRYGNGMVGLRYDVGTG